MSHTQHYTCVTRLGVQRVCSSGHGGQGGRYSKLESCRHPRHLPGTGGPGAAGRARRARRVTSSAPRPAARAARAPLAARACRLRSKTLEQKINTHYLSVRTADTLQLHDESSTVLTPRADREHPRPPHSLPVFSPHAAHIHTSPRPGRHITTLGSGGAAQRLW